VQVQALLVVLQRGQALLDLAPYRDQQLALLLGSSSSSSGSSAQAGGSTVEGTVAAAAAAAAAAAGGGAGASGDSMGGHGDGEGEEGTDGAADEGGHLVLLPPPSLHPVPAWRSHASVLQVGELCYPMG